MKVNPIAPLLEEERYVCALTLITQVVYPMHIHRDCLGWIHFQTFSSTYYPLQAILPFTDIYRAEHGFNGGKSYWRRDFMEVDHPLVGTFLILHGRTDPCIAGPLTINSVIRNHRPHVFRTFGEKLKYEVFAFSDGTE